MVSLGLVFLDDKLDLASGNAAAGIEFLHGPFVAPKPLTPALAAMPARGVRMPSLTGFAWAKAGEKTPGDAAAALAAPIDCMAVRREIFMGRFLVGRLFVGCALPGARQMICHAHVRCHAAPVNAFRAG